MKRNMGLCICLLAPLLGLAGLKDEAPSQAGALYDEVEATSRRAAAGTRAALVPALTRVYPAITNLAAREAITAVLGLNAMMDRKEADALRYREHLRTTYPKSRYQSLLDPATYMTNCVACSGKGRRAVPCSTCNGTGKCTRCGGRGSFPRMGTVAGGLSGGLSGTRTVTPTANDKAQEECIVCKGAGKCKTCDGRKTVESVCTVCQGRGQVQSNTVRLAFAEMALRLADLAFAAGQAERGRALFEGKWLEAADYARITRLRKEAYDYVTRAATEADAAANFALARTIMEQAVAKYPDEPVAWHAKELLALVNRDETARRTRANVADDAKQAVADAVEQIPARIGAVLDARRLRAKAPPSLLAPETADALPIDPLSWRVETPLVISRTARVAVAVDLPTRSGQAMPTRWMFLMIHGKDGWRIVRVDPA